MGNISVTLYTTTHIDNKRLLVECTEHGRVGIIIGDGMSGKQHLIFGPEDARTLGEALLAAADEAIGAVA